MTAASDPASDAHRHDDLETSVARMARIGFCVSPSFSPGGERLAFVSTLSGLPQVWMVEIGRAHV